MDIMVSSLPQKFPFCVLSAGCPVIDWIVGVVEPSLMTFAGMTGDIFLAVVL